MEGQVTDLPPEDIEQPETPPEPTDDRPEENRVAESKRKADQALKRAEEIQAERDELAKWKEERENADLSEGDKILKRAERAETRAKAAEDRAERLERGGWLRDAATRAGYNDPADAVDFAYSRNAISGLDEQKKADKFVTDLAEEKQHLLHVQAQPGPFGSLTDNSPRDNIPRDGNGEPDLKRGMGQDLLAHLTGKR